MEPSNFPTSRAPLKIRKDSHEIKKPPVIIYTVSPKVIHVNNPSDFKNLVQRLTGSTSSLFSGSSLHPPLTSDHQIFIDTTKGAISPAARFAAIEKTKPAAEGRKKQRIYEENNGFVQGIEMNPGVERTSFLPGILCPGPTSLPRISPSFFSPPSDPNSIGFFHDLSPVLHGKRNFIQGH